MRATSRWWAVVVFMLASSLSYLDRQLLAAVAPAIQREFQLSSAEYGVIVSAFSLTYALSAPLAGWFLDRAGLNIGITLSLGLWSMAGIATAFTSGFPGLLACRAWLGFSESANIPATGKANGLYLRPGERTMGPAINQVAISVGMVGAPVLASKMMAVWGWRSPFLVAGVLGFLWIPLWLALSRRIPQNAVNLATAMSVRAMTFDRRLWGLVAANIVGMLIYSLWMNWTTVFLVKTHGLSATDANLRLAWIPPVFAAAGGLAGGSIGLRLARQAKSLTAARLRGVLLAACLLLPTALAPVAPTPALATAAICWSFFWAVAMSVNIYTLPIDYFGAERAGFAIAALTFAYGLMQTVTSPAIGRAVDVYGFGPVCAFAALTPLMAWAILRVTGERH
ncbi:MAG: MFS transporter [Bryobacterales bacterium]|nr:MFS transporter [Bryobacterales bacterium]